MVALLAALLPLLLPLGACATRIEVHSCPEGQQPPVSSDASVVSVCSVGEAARWVGAAANAEASGERLATRGASFVPLIVSVTSAVSSNP